MTQQRITLAHGPDGHVVQAVAVGFDPDSDADRSVLEALKAMIDDRPNVIAFDDSIEVRHAFPEDAVRARIEALCDDLERSSHGGNWVRSDERRGCVAEFRAALAKPTVEEGA